MTQRKSVGVQCVIGESEARAICFRFVEHFYFHHAMNRKKTSSAQIFSITYPIPNIRPRFIHSISKRTCKEMVVFFPKAGS